MPTSSLQDSAFPELDRLLRQIEDSQSWRTSEIAIQGFRSIAHVLTNDPMISSTFLELCKEAEASVERPEILRAFNWRGSDWTTLSLEQAGTRLREVERTLISEADRTYHESSELIRYALGIRDHIGDRLNLQIDPSKPYANAIALLIYDSYFRARDAFPAGPLNSPNHYPYDYALLLRLCGPIISCLRRRISQRASNRTGRAISTIGNLFRTNTPKIVGSVIASVIAAGLTWHFGFSGGSGTKIETRDSSIRTQTNIGQQVNNYVNDRPTIEDSRQPKKERALAALTIDQIIQTGADATKDAISRSESTCDAAATALSAVSGKADAEKMFTANLLAIDSTLRTTNAGINTVLVSQGVPSGGLGDVKWLGPQAEAYNKFKSSCESARHRIADLENACTKRLDRMPQ